MIKDIEKLKKFCLRCQQRKKSTNKKTPSAPLPILELPNLQVHADLFGPLITADSNKKFVLCITDAFTKYAVVTTIANKDAETVDDAIYKEWFYKFGIPVQIHMDGSKEFVKKLSAELFQLLNVSHIKMSPAHPQCNAQVEVLKKTVKKFLQSFVDDTTLYWETFLLTLAISYNTSYHSTITTTPFELLFGEKARLQSFPKEAINDSHSDGPVTRACTRLINFKNAAYLALIMLNGEGDENINSLCLACDSENEYFKLNPPQQNFTQKYTDCDKYAKLFITLKEREDQCYQLKKKQINYSCHHQLHQKFNQIKSFETQLKTGITESFYASH
jgi:hypothetical protein